MGYILRSSYTYLNVNIDDLTKLAKDTCFVLILILKYTFVICQHNRTWRWAFTW